MSELNSLYVRIKIKKENLERFFQDKPMLAEIDEDWTSWWNSREMYSPSPLTEIPVYSDFPAFSSATNRDVLASFSKDPQTGTHQQQDGHQEGLSFSILFFSENYEEILPMLAWLKSIARYMDAGDEGVALIYDFFWGGGSVMALLAFSNQQASLDPASDISEIDPAVLKAANTTLQNAFDVISAQYGDAD